MKIAEEIIKMIKNAEFVVDEVNAESNLYTDLGYDSLAFVSLLLEIEKVFSIRFELLEMGMCVRAAALIELVEEKVKESALKRD